MTIAKWRKCLHKKSSTHTKLVPKIVLRMHAPRPKHPASSSISDTVRVHDGRLPSGLWWVMVQGAFGSSSELWTTHLCNITGSSSLSATRSIGKSSSRRSQNIQMGWYQGSTTSKPQDIPTCSSTTQKQTFPGGHFGLILPITSLWNEIT